MFIYYKTVRPVIKRIFYSLYAFFLRIFSFLLFWIRPRPLDTGKAYKILLVKVERIGDLVLSTPAIRAIRGQFPHSSISIIVNPPTRQIIENDPYLNEVIAYDIKGTHGNFRQKIRFIRNLRSRKFDLGIDLSTRDFFFTPAWLLCLSGTKINLGLDNYARGFLFNIKVKSNREPMPLAQEVLHILSPLGTAISDIKPKLFVSGEDKNYVQEYLNREGINKENLLIAIHPGGFYETQRWRADGFAKVARYLIERYKARVVFVGSQEENKLINEIMSLITDKPINLAGKTSLGQLMALIQRCHLFIGNSSGPLHIALGFNIPTISFLGPTLPERWQPQSRENIVFRKDLPCSPCGLGYCWRKDFACMKEIRPEEVMDAVDSQLKLFFKGIS